MFILLALKIPFFVLILSLDWCDDFNRPITGIKVEVESSNLLAFRGCFNCTKQHKRIVPLAKESFTYEHI